MEMYNYQIIAKETTDEKGYIDCSFWLGQDCAYTVGYHLERIAEKHGVSLEDVYSELHLVSILNEYDNINVELLQLNTEGSLEPMDF